MSFVVFTDVPEERPSNDDTPNDTDAPSNDTDAPANDTDAHTDASANDDSADRPIADDKEEQQQTAPELTMLAEAASSVCSGDVDSRPQPSSGLALGHQQQSCRAPGPQPVSSGAKLTRSECSDELKYRSGRKHRAPEDLEKFKQLTADRIYAVTKPFGVLNTSYIWKNAMLKVLVDPDVVDCFRMFPITRSLLREILRMVPDMQYAVSDIPSASVSLEWISRSLARMLSQVKYTECPHEQRRIICGTQHFCLKKKQVIEVPVRAPTPASTPKTPSAKTPSATPRSVASTPRGVRTPEDETVDAKDDDGIVISEVWTPLQTELVRRLALVGNLKTRSETMSHLTHILSQKEVQALFPYDVKMTRRSRVFDYMIRQIPQMHYLRSIRVLNRKAFFSIVWRNISVKPAVVGAKPAVDKKRKHSSVQFQDEDVVEISIGSSAPTPVAHKRQKKSETQLSPSVALSVHNMLSVDPEMPQLFLTYFKASDAVDATRVKLLARMKSLIAAKQAETEALNVQLRKLANSNI